VQIRPLYSPSARIPGALLPFRVEGTATVGGKVDRVSVASNTAGVDCRVMKDPYRPLILLVKCVDEGEVMLNVRVLNGYQAYNVSFGPIEVKKPAADLVVVEPLPPDPKILAGRQLWIANCVGCHTDARAKSGRSVAQIKNAIDTQTDMVGATYLKSLSTADLDKIAAYLGSL
jgi:hypothetical protein